MGELNEVMNVARRAFRNTPWQSDKRYVFKTFGDEVVFMHRCIAEKALGKQLPIGAVVHHYNGNGNDNRHFNLVICPNEEYHLLLHERTKKVFGERPYPALKKASYEHRENAIAESRNREPRPYMTFAEVMKPIQARVTVRVLKDSGRLEEWFRNRPLGMSWPQMTNE